MQRHFHRDLWEYVVPPGKGVAGAMWPGEVSTAPMPANQPWDLGQVISPRSGLCFPFGQKGLI